MKKLSFIICCLFCCLCFKQAAYAFSMDPARIELTIAGGRQKGKAVTIDNSRSDQTLHLKVYVTDVIFLPDGTNDFPPAGSTERSCAGWVKIIPEEIDIPAGKTQSVRVNVSVPQGAAGGYYGIVFFESASTSVEGGLNINFRVGGLLDVTVANTEVRQAKLTGISFTKPNYIDVDIFNEGNILIRPKGKIKILDSRGKKIKQLDFNPQGWGILPKSLRKFRSELKETLSSAKYRLKLEIDYGVKYLLVGELPIEIE